MAHMWKLGCIGLLMSLGFLVMSWHFMDMWHGWDIWWPSYGPCTLLWSLSWMTYMGVWWPYLSLMVHILGSFPRMLDTSWLVSWYTNDVLKMFLLWAFSPIWHLMDYCLHITTCLKLIKLSHRSTLLKITRNSSTLRFDLIGIYDIETFLGRPCSHQICRSILNFCFDITR